MFNVCRRGTASLSNIIRIAPRRIPTPSWTLSIQKQCTKEPAIRLFGTSLKVRQAQAAARVTPVSQEKTHLITRFDELTQYNLVHPNVVNAITHGMGHEIMTEVQTATINEALQGIDVIAQARTGTGKTLGFLIPTIQNIINDNPEIATRTNRVRARASDIRAIIISPTRELAEQIAVEAVKLTQKTDIIVQVATGGNSKSFMLNKTRREGCHILVCTPGRLYDLLSDPYSGIRAPQLKTFVLDEADRLLDDGFSKDIEAISGLLPPVEEVDRQTMMFSATVPREVMHLVRQTLKRDFKFVQTVKEGDIATHERIPQKIVTAPGFENLAPAILELCKRGIENAKLEKQKNPDAKDFKAIVYFNSTATVELFASIFENLGGAGGRMFSQHPLYPTEIFQIHGKLSQAERTRAAGNFRRGKSGMLFSSDVTARGMDFPDVTHVIQVRCPQTRDQYIHRVGRTGRGGKGGEGWILIHKDEVGDARNRLRGLPIGLDKSLQSAELDMTKDAQLPASLAATLQEVAAAVKLVPRNLKVAVYTSELRQKGNSSKNPTVVKALNQWSKYGWGWDKPPALSFRQAQLLGVHRIEGMNIQDSAREGGFGEDDFGDGGSGGRSFGDRGFGGSGSGDRGFGGRSSSGRSFGDRGFGGGGSGERGFGGRNSGGRSGDRGGNRSFGDRGRSSGGRERTPKLVSNF